MEPVFRSSRVPIFRYSILFLFFRVAELRRATGIPLRLDPCDAIPRFVFYLNLYVLLRCAAITPWASYVGASVGFLAWNTELYASWITITASYAWLPLALAGAVLLLRSPGKACGILVFSVATGLLALASPSQAVIHTALSCLLLFAIAIAWFCLRRDFASIRDLAWSLIVSAGIILGLAGAAILPMYLATGGMIRAIGRGPAVVGHGRIPWEYFNLAQLSLSQAAGVLIRPTWIQIIGSPYVGPLGVIGTLLTLIYCRRLDPFLRMLVLAFGIVFFMGCFQVSERIWDLRLSTSIFLLLTGSVRRDGILFFL